MAIKAGDILHVGNGDVLVERIQTGGPGNVNIPTEKINELGNYLSVATIRDVPDLTFTAESLDATTDFERLLLARAGAPAAGDRLEMSKARPLNIASQFKPGRDAPDPYTIVGSVGLPGLVLESLSYRFGLRDNASQTATLRGDSIFYNPGSTYVQTVAGSGVAGQEVTLDHPAYSYNGDTSTGPRRVLSVDVNGKPLFLGPDYTEAAGAEANGAAAVTVTLARPVDASSVIHVMYASPDAQRFEQTVHSTPDVKPAAIRGRNLFLYIGDPAGSDLAALDVANRWGSVQSATIDFRLNLERDEEFGNARAVSQDFTEPATTGSFDLKTRDVDELFRRIRQISNVAAADQVTGALTSQPLPMHLVLTHPEDVDVNGNPVILKALHVPDARFTLPGYSGRVQQKLTVTFPMESDTGELVVIQG